MYDITTIGAAIQDLYVFSKEFSVHADPRKTSGRSEFFEFGTKIELEDIYLGVGGGASNAAYTFKNQGLKTACVARVGDDGIGMDIKKSIKSYGIKDSLIIDKKNRTGRGVFFLGRSGEKTVLVYRGASKEFKPAEIKKSFISGTKWLYITSLGGNMVTLEKIANLAVGLKKQFMINPGKSEIINYKKRLLKVLSKARIILLNREEASLLTSRAYVNILGIMKKMSEFCPRSIILVTDGLNGIYTTVNNQIKYVIIKPVASVDMTGAGDAFGSGFLAGYIRSKGNIDSSINLALVNSASVVKKIGAKQGLAKKLKLSNKLNYKFKKLI